ncbi:MAG: tRNA pseudouridine(38-40) synthase TruA [Terriglobia bacterium]
MRTLKLTLAYDGSEFYGWQLQPNLPTIQGTLLDTLRKLTQEKPRLYGCGRTDAGVHALGQVAHFKTRTQIPAENMRRALNSLLPPSVRVLAVEEVAPNFHSRWHALAKTYRYRILRAPICPPHLWRYVYHYPYPLDEEVMGRAAPRFEGERDFSSFGTWDPEEENRSRVRIVYSSRLERLPEQHELVYTVRGKSFLRYMVRKMVGTLIDVGKGRLGPEDIHRIFTARDRSQAGPTVPPEGLYLVAAEYPVQSEPATIASAQSQTDSV